ncbi:MAG: lipoate--protein ligase [Bacteroidales bacterium]|nr:lipoate--protein ligase [Bacteroidales bacterium]
MRCFISDTKDPYYNLATEEYLLRRRTEDFFFVWISKPAVIVGKHQNTLAEINPHFVCDHKICIARRLSGGGAVFHDNGNLNFTFITNEESNKLVDFKRYALPVTEFLGQFGIKATIGIKNEILAGGLKISGNAKHVYKNRVLHHGTLLLNTDLKCLHSALSGNSERYKSRAVASNRSQVVNIADLPGSPPDIESFSGMLFSYIKTTYGGIPEKPDREDTARIRQLADDKYSTWEWIYGYSPEYRFENEFYDKDRKVKIAFTVQKGIIYDFAVQTNLFTRAVCKNIALVFNGRRHTWEDLLPVVKDLKLPGIPVKENTDFFMTNLF